jgi:hypothetical protein
MSQVAISGNASGTGTLTIAAPNTNSNYTLTLPQNTGTFITTSSTGQVIPRAALPTGSVLQVVNATYATSTSSTTSTYADTGLTATITPSSSSSKILVIVSQNGCRKQSNDTYIGIRLLRASTTIFTPITAASYTASAATNDIGSVSCEYLDSPATTSATTYKTQFNSGNNTATVFVQVGNDGSTMTLMEISA